MKKKNAIISPRKKNHIDLALILIWRNDFWLIITLFSGSLHWKHDISMTHVPHPPRVTASLMALRILTYSNSNNNHIAFQIPHEKRCKRRRLLFVLVSQFHQIFHSGFVTEHPNSHGNSVKWWLRFKPSACWDTKRRGTAANAHIKITQISIRFSMCDLLSDAPKTDTALKNTQYSS